MNRIDDYIEKIYRNFDDRDEETKILKEETRVHLLDEIEELNDQGLTEEESIKIALNRFGELGKVENELSEVLKFQKKFASNILIASLVTLLLAVICFASYKVTYKTFSLRVPAVLKTAVEHKIQTGEKVSSDDVNELLMKYNKQFRYVSIYEENNNDLPNIISPSNFSAQEVQKDESTLTTYVNSPDGKEFTVRYGFDIKGFNLSISPVILIIAKAFFIVYWICFGTWSVINAYHKKSFSLAWVFLFFALNVIAYAAFVLYNANNPRESIA
ncbi:permease prefix domain 1-containing protein [Clostridium beijerinckii]|uniref:permease prefix domain 1-containing protein n=1 Tax=Clostridium beijerinckii TaxID=1520 RepID=UPI0002DAA0BE|nr:permease prefix domain 1-containing protein [Clostridium beijerinckii]